MTDTSKKLFRITINGAPTEETFEKKADARVRRDALLKDGKNAKISRGPDHYLGASRWFANED